LTGFGRRRNAVHSSGKSADKRLKGCLMENAFLSDKEVSLSAAAPTASLKIPTFNRIKEPLNTYF
jgi:hypothetical protein